MITQQIMGIAEMKKIISRDDFEISCKDAAKEMVKDTVLLKKALDVKVEAGHNYSWVRQTRWFGEPCLQLPTDLIALQEVVFREKPDLIIESGVAWGGTTLFLANMLNVIGKGKVLGIDIFLPLDLRDRLNSNLKLKDYFTLLEGSSTDVNTFNQVKKHASNAEKVMVILDSDHTHDHVFAELNLYSELVTTGQYLLVCDTAIAIQPSDPNRIREWNDLNNPKTALDQFLKSKKGSRFQQDHEIDAKLLISNNWGGYLKKIA